MSKFIPLCTAFALAAACAHDSAPAPVAHERNWEQGLDSEHSPQIAPLGPLENDQFAYDFIRRREREHALGTKSTASDLDEIIGNSSQVLASAVILASRPVRARSSSAANTPSLAARCKHRVTVC